MMNEKYIKCSENTLRGILDYRESYTAFLQHTTQFDDTIRLIEQLLRRLESTILPAPAGAVLNIADLGCNDAWAAIHYVGSWRSAARIHYYGVDISEEALLNARRSLDSLEPPFAKTTLVRMDAFNENIQQNQQMRPSGYDLIFVSHSAYYVRHDDTGQPAAGHAELANKLSAMLNPNGIAVLIHGNSFLPIRKKFGDALARDTPALLWQGAALAGLDQIKPVDFHSKLIFQPMPEDMWHDLRYTERYQNYRDNTLFTDTLNKLGFIINLNLVDLECDGLLSSFIDEIRMVMKNNLYVFPIVSTLQLIVSPHCKNEIALAHAVAQLEKL